MKKVSIIPNKKEFQLHVDGTPVKNTDSKPINFKTKDDCVYWMRKRNLLNN